jgi:hypothetical protein
MASIKTSPSFKHLEFEGTLTQVNALQGSYIPGAMYGINNVTVAALGICSFYSHALNKFTLSAEGYLVSSSVNLAIEAYTARIKYTTGEITYVLDTIRNNEVDGSVSVGLFPFNKAGITNTKVSGGSTIDYTHPTGSIDGCVVKNGSTVHVGVLDVTNCTFDNSDVSFLSVTGTLADSTFSSQNVQDFSNTVINIQRSSFTNSSISVDDSVSFTALDSIFNTASIIGSFAGALTISKSTIDQNSFIEGVGATITIADSTITRGSSVNDFSGAGTIQITSTLMDTAAQIYQNAAGLTVTNSTTLLSNSSFSNSSNAQSLLLGCYAAGSSQFSCSGSGSVAANMQYCAVLAGGWIQNSPGTSGSVGSNTIYDCAVSSQGRLWKTGTGIIQRVSVSSSAFITLAMSAGSQFTRSTFSSEYIGNFTITGTVTKLDGLAQSYTAALSGVTGTGSRNF